MKKQYLWKIVSSDTQMYHNSLIYREITIITHTRHLARQIKQELNLKGKIQKEYQEPLDE